MATDQLAILLRVRARTLVNHVGSARRTGAAVVLALVATALAALGLGTASVEGLVAMATRPPVQGEVTSAGGVYADVGFWLAAVMLMFFSFRIMEALYRKQDVRLLAAYPIALSTQFHYRVLAAAGELVAGLVVAGLFFAPVIVVSGDSRAAAAFALVAASLAVALPLGFAVQLRAGVASFGTGGSKLGEVGRVDMGGGSPAAFSFSPAVAFIGSLVVLLVLKLAVIDEFFERGPTRLFWVGVGVPALVAAASYLVARRTFVLHYPFLLARFYEADLIVFDSGYAYHKSVTEGRRGLVERLLPTWMLAHYRKDSLQFARRYPLLRLTHVALWVAVGIVGAGDHLATSGLALVPMFYLVSWAAPWARLAGTEIEPGYLANMPVQPGHVTSSKAVASAREAMVAAGPAALIVALTAWPGGLGWAAVGLVVAVAPVPLLQVFSGRSVVLGWLAGVGLAGATGVLAALVGPWAVTLAVAASLVGFALIVRRLKT